MTTSESPHSLQVTAATVDWSEPPAQPSTSPEQSLIDSCVHCGFCLSTCPSYRVIGKETDSPRGRVYLMNGLNQGDFTLTDAAVGHFDTCLGCLACVSTCPSGVEYDQLITSTRAQIEQNYQRSLPQRLLRKMLFSLLPYPQRLRRLLGPLQLYQKLLGLQSMLRQSGLLARVLPKSLVAMESLLPPIEAQAFTDPESEIFPAQGKRRYRVGLILGCIQRLFLSEVNQATIRVLTANGCEVVVPRSQGCCAALPHHQGQVDQAQDLARQMMDSFADYDLDAVIVNASGCGHTLKEYGHILQDDPAYRDRAQAFAHQVKDVQEFLDEVGLTTPLSPLQPEPLAVVYQDACHMLHGQKIQAQPRRLLQQIPGLELREPRDAFLCCGSAGVYNILQPDIAEELGQQKVQNLTQTGATLIASANVGCTMQIRKHLDQQDHTTPVLHPMQLLDCSIRGVSWSTAVGNAQDRPL
ncbi:(Fe-S)-binding protein [Acaryochloris marina]|uniref:Glycolate oxidase iron-sulfur subunit n=1 Tax=Acaryochloris marina (strain MBIC 11017) TaxID=329726 RepID=B0C962_ACAM1|nr:heterodisulfide reductase-related iron-sulfur binding cluster [Acaryochloris marina]ABW27743.1 glycolate oxidase subunit [Acaryochloris marina MBIC11017]